MYTLRLLDKGSRGVFKERNPDVTNSQRVSFYNFNLNFVHLAELSFLIDQQIFFDSFPCCSQGRKS
jgi:hypothetical protein